MQRYFVVGMAAVCVLLPGTALAAKSGEQVYKEVCQVCHAAGLANAPKLGDAARWAPLIKEGQVTLTVDGWLGIRAMPPKGGNSSLSLQEFAGAVAYMARAGGAKWQDPDAKMLSDMQAFEKNKLAVRTKKK